MCNCGGECSGATCICPCHGHARVESVPQAEVAVPKLLRDAPGPSPLSGWEAEELRKDMERLRKIGAAWKRAYLALSRAMNAEAGEDIF